MSYVIVSVVSFIVGNVIGVMLLALCVVSKSIEEQEERNRNGCFGATFGDCDSCPKNKERGTEND